MDAISSTPDFTTTNIFTSYVLLACINHRLKKYNAEVSDRLKELAIKNIFTKRELSKETEWNLMNFVKSLCPAGRINQTCDVKKFTDGRKLIQYLEQHPTYTLSQSHKNNVTWYQISELIQFTVDLVEECHAAGRTELVQFLVDWCVSFISQQSCIYTSSGWVDMLTILPPISDSDFSIISNCSANVSARQRLTGKETADQEHHMSVSSSESNSHISDGNLFNIRSFTREEKMQSGKEDHSGGDSQSGNFTDDSINTTTFSKQRLVGKSLSSNTYAALAATSKEKELLLLTCSCGNENKRKKEKFFSVCDSLECGKLTCSICCASVKKINGSRHIAQHKLNRDSAITNEHVDMNAELFRAVCSNCGNRSCIKDSPYSQNMGICKLCKTHFCTHPGCGKLGDYNTIYRHQRRKHTMQAVGSKKPADSNPETSVKSNELQLLRCACKNIDSMEKHGKFWCKCGIQSCEYYQYYICLICGRTSKDKEQYLKIHLGHHETDNDGQVKEKHVETNTRLYNKVCGKCGQQSSGKYTTLNEHNVAQCRCCKAYLCMFPECKKYYLLIGSAGCHKRTYHS